MRIWRKGGISYKENEKVADDELEKVNVQVLGSSQSILCEALSKYRAPAQVQVNGLIASDMFVLAQKFVCAFGLT